MKFFKKNIIWILLILIITFSFLLRIVKINDTPPSLYWDEVSQGYNAYSLLHSGRDEHEEFFPLARFVAFGDYKAPVYTYTIIPFMSVLGKSDLAVRLPSIIFGTLTVLALFFLARELFIKDKKRDTIALLSAFMLAIVPWHIQLSRAAYEGNIAVMFTVVGAYFFIYAIRQKSWVLLISTLAFVLAFYSFNVQKIFVPTLVLLLSILYYKEIWKVKKIAIIAGVFGFILLIPYIQFFMSPESKLRFNEVNIFSDLSIIEESNRLQQLEENSPLARIMFNRRVLFAQEYVQNYFDFYNPNFLFLSGDGNPRFSHQNNGELYLWQLPLILIGVYQLARGEKRRAIFLFGWLLLAPIAGATARETPHALRAELLLPIFSILSGLGACALYCYIKNNHKRFFLSALILGLLIICYSIFTFMYNYTTHFPKEYSGEWQYGYKEVVQKIDTISDQYDTIYMTSEYGRPYIYVLFYTNTTPMEFWENSEVEKDQFGLYNVNKFGKYIFSDTIPENLEGKILVVTTPSQVPDGYTTIDEVKFLNGKTAFTINEKSDE